MGSQQSQATTTRTSLKEDGALLEALAEHLVRSSVTDRRDVASMKVSAHQRPRLRMNLQVTTKGWWAIEQARRLRLHPDLDPIMDWVEIPSSWLGAEPGVERYERGKARGKAGT